MHFRIFDSVVTILVISTVAIAGLCLLAYFAPREAKASVYARFVVSKQYGFVLDPEYYCPTEPGAERPWAELESGEMVQFDDTMCVVSRALLEQEKALATETDTSHDLK